VGPFFRVTRYPLVRTKEIVALQSLINILGWLGTQQFRLSHVSLHFEPVVRTLIMYSRYCCSGWPDSREMKIMEMSRIFYWVTKCQNYVKSKIVKIYAKYGCMRNGEWGVRNEGGLFWFQSCMAILLLVWRLKKKDIFELIKLQKAFWSRKQKLFPANISNIATKTFISIDLLAFLCQMHWEKGIWFFVKMRISNYCQNGTIFSHFDNKLILKLRKI